MLYPLNPLIYTANNMNTVYLREKYVFLKKEVVFYEIAFHHTCTSLNIWPWKYNLFQILKLSSIRQKRQYCLIWKIC